MLRPLGGDQDVHIESDRPSTTSDRLQSLNLMDGAEQGSLEVALVPYDVGRRPPREEGAARVWTVPVICAAHTRAQESIPCMSPVFRG